MASAVQTAAAKAINAERAELGFDPMSILAIIQMIQALIAGCKKQETSDPADAQYACICALHGYGSKQRNKRVRAAAKKSLPRAERTEEKVDALLAAVAKASPSSFSALWSSVEV